MLTERRECMRTTKSLCTDPSILKNRMAVSDVELTYLLGVGLLTARRIAENANAVVFDGKRRLTIVSKLQKYLDNLAK